MSFAGFAELTAWSALAIMVAVWVWQIVAALKGKRHRDFEGEPCSDFDWQGRDDEGGRR